MHPVPGSAAEMRYADITVGMQASFSRRVTAADVDRFAELSGDRNPLHMDDAYAATTEFGQRAVHGLLLGAFLSRLIGMHLPGRFALYLSQSLDFARPVHPGDDIEVSGRVLSKHDATRTVVLETIVTLAGGDVAARGRALVKVLQ